MSGNEEKESLSSLFAEAKTKTLVARLNAEALVHYYSNPKLNHYEVFVLSKKYGLIWNCDKYEESYGLVKPTAYEEGKKIYVIHKGFPLSVSFNFKSQKINEVNKEAVLKMFKGKEDDVKYKAFMANLIQMDFEMFLAEHGLSPSVFYAQIHSKYFTQAFRPKRKKLVDFTVMFIIILLVAVSVWFAVTMIKDARIHELELLLRGYGY